MIFTRYLYIKDEVKQALFISLLEKSDDCLFWAYELYYSGFGTELFELIWKIYYECYAVLNPKLESFIHKNIQLMLGKTCFEPGDHHLIVGRIISTMSIRPFNLEVFMLRHIMTSFESDVDEICDMDEMIEKRDFVSVAFMINNGYKSPICVQNYADYKIVLLSKIIQMKTISKEKNIFIAQDESDLKYANTYEHLDANDVLKHACLYNIDVNLGQGLFKSDRIDVLKCYHTDWLYYASFSPIWMKRILEYNGHVCNNAVIFNDDDADEFNEKYYYDTDEQTLETQHKNIQPITKQSCELFYRKYQTFDFDDYLNDIEYFQL
jgi:hypothetical protein